MISEKVTGVFFKAWMVFFQSQHFLFDLKLLYLTKNLQKKNLFSLLLESNHFSLDLIYVQVKYKNISKPFFKLTKALKT